MTVNRLTPEANRLIAAMVANTNDLAAKGVEQDNVLAPAEVWQEVRDEFPLDLLDDYIDEEGDLFVERKVKS